MPHTTQRKTKNPRWATLVVLDETDELLESGFVQHVHLYMRQICPEQAGLPVFGHIAYPHRAARQRRLAVSGLFTSMLGPFKLAAALQAVGDGQYSLKLSSTSSSRTCRDGLR